MTQPCFNARESLAYYQGYSIYPFILDSALSISPRILNIRLCSNGLQLAPFTHSDNKYNLIVCNFKKNRHCVVMNAYSYYSFIYIQAETAALVKVEVSLTFF